MYNILRKIHLYAGLIILAFLIMYFATGYVLIHEFFGRRGPKPTPIQRTESLASFTGQRTPNELIPWIADQFAIRGRLVPKSVRQSETTLAFTITRPGFNTQVELHTGSDQLSLKSQPENFPATLAQLHRVHGYGGGWIFNLWGVFNDLAALSCILFALTGVYLWWKTTKQKIWGILCLSASCLYGLGMILYLLYAR